MTSPKSESTRAERVPRADKLHLLRDITHLLNDSEGIAGRRMIFYKARDRVTKSEGDFAVESTFDDYISLGGKLGLMKVTPSGRISTTLTFDATSGP